jgi:hypothetical protein
MALPAIENLQDLMHWLSASDPNELNRRLYKGTNCGAYISVLTTDGKWYHCGDDWSGVTEITAFAIGTIVEGSDIGVDAKEFCLPTTDEAVEEWCEEMEMEATRLWENANYEHFTVYRGEECVGGGRITWDTPPIEFSASLPEGHQEAIIQAIQNKYEESFVFYDESQFFDVAIGDVTYTIKGYVMENW